MQCAATNPVPPVTSTTSPLMCPLWAALYSRVVVVVRGLTLWDDSARRPAQASTSPGGASGPGAPGGPSQCAGAGHSMPYEASTSTVNA